MEPVERVDFGDELAIVQAMKMENVLRAARAGKVMKLHAKAGDTLSVGQIILEFEERRASSPSPLTRAPRPLSPRGRGSGRGIA